MTELEIKQALKSNPSGNSPEDYVIVSIKPSLSVAVLGNETVVVYQPSSDKSSLVTYWDYQLTPPHVKGSIRGSYAFK